MKWNEQVSKAISEANSNRYGIKVIRKYFNPDEIKNLLTAIYYSKLYYGVEICHLPLFCYDEQVSQRYKCIILSAQ